MTTMRNVTGFWGWFAERNVELLEIISGKREGRVTQMIDRALAENGLNLSYDVTEGVFGGELTFTPEGDPSVAEFIDGFVASAPSFDAWVIFPRRQRKSLAAAHAFVEVLHGIDLHDLHFKVVELEGRYHLCFLHDGLLALDEEHRYAVAGTFLDHALGEEILMRTIGQLEFRPSGPGIEMSLLINSIIRETMDADIAAPMQGP